MLDSLVVGNILLRLLGIFVLACVVFAAYSFFKSNQPVGDKKTKGLGYSPIEAITLTVAGYIISQVIAAVLFAAYAQGVNRNGGDVSTGENLGFIAVVSLTYSLIAWAFLKRRGVSLGSVGINTARASHLAYGLLAFFIYLPVTGYVQYLIGKSKLIDVNQAQELGFSTVTAGPELLAIFIALVVIPPLCEEFVMRGFLYTGLRSKMTFLNAALVTSIIFGIAHLQIGSGNPPLWVAAADTFVLSMFLVFLREKNKSLWPAITLHALKNFVAFMVLFVLKLPIV